MHAGYVACIFNYSIPILNPTHKACYDIGLLYLPLELHELVLDGENHSFFQLYTNQSKEKVDLGTRWNDKHIEPDSTETLLYRYSHYYSQRLKIDDSVCPYNIPYGAYISQVFNFANSRILNRLRNLFQRKFLTATVQYMSSAHVHEIISTKFF